jgi:UDP-N-acetylmuramoylalanine--D-glutamate ligase
MNKAIIDDLKAKFIGKKILVVGLGLQGGGVGIARFFSEIGGLVTVTDKKTESQLEKSVLALNQYPINYHLGGHQEKDFLEADVIFKGPSVLWTEPEIVKAVEKGIPVEMELSFFVKNFPGRTIGITGTRGKSTTTHLIYNLLKQSSFPVYLGGGLPGISTISYLNKLTKDDWIVMEISSWALSGFHKDKISPHIAVLTNLYPDHLNYYKNMDEYIYDKKAIFVYQKKDDYIIVNSNLLDSVSNFFHTRVSPVLGPLESEKKFTTSSMLLFSKKDFPSELKYLKGEHNLENAAAALQVAKILKIDEKKAVDIISSFQGLPYRQQIIGEKNGIVFINDTTSTTPIATIKAIESFKNQKIILILGGNSKKLPFQSLINNLEKVEKIVLLAGSFTNEIAPVLKETFPGKLSDKIYEDLQNAIFKAYEYAVDCRPSIVLFSPGATSFAMFNNEFHRGDEFNNIVKKIL